MLSLKLFLGKPSIGCGSVGFWITLPMSKTDLNSCMDSFYENYSREYIISSTEQYGYAEVLTIGQYDDVFSVNDLLLKINSMNEYDMKLYLTILSHFDQDEKMADKFIKNKRFEYFEDVQDDESLGERIIEQKLLGYVPERLMSFINLEKIGHEWECNGTRLYIPLKTALREISEREYNEKVRKGLIK